MNTKPFLIRLALVLICSAVLLSLGFWLARFPRSSVADELSPFYSPIHPTGNPQLELVKTIDNDQPQVGDEVVYTLTYANTNPGSQAFNVRLYEFMPAGLQFVSSNPPATYHSGGALLFSAPSVGPTTGNVQVSVRARVLEGFDRLYNHSLLVADGVVPVHASLVTPVTQPPRWLRLVKTGYAYTLIDDELVYTLMCQNTSDATVNNVTLAEVLPTGLPLVAASPAPDDARLPLLTWSLGDLEPGERRTVVITTTAPGTAVTFNNTALADARQRVVTQTLFSTRVLTEGAILRVSKRGSAPVVHVGDQLVYTLRYENAGNQVATGVRLTDTFPAGISVTGVSTPALSLSGQRGIWTLGTLVPDARGQILITTTVGGIGGRTLLNVADIAGQPGSFPDHAELETDVLPFALRLPIVMRNY